jgi:RHS repeat-associated protein
MGRRRTVFYPFNGMTANYRYDRLGTLRRLISDNPGSEYAFDRFEVTVQHDSVDVLGRVLRQNTVCPYNEEGQVAVPCRDWLPRYTSNRYNRLGALVVQERTGTGPALDTMRYDRSGNLIQRHDAMGAKYFRSFIYPSLSNRIATQRDSAGGSLTHSDQNFIYDAAGNRIRRIKVGTPDTTVWQYDALSRLVGAASRLGPQILPHFNECRWDAAWRLAQPCGNGGQLSFMGENVARSSLGWFFVQAPGIDETVLLVYRNIVNDNWAMFERLQAVTDGRGQVIAIADSLGDITGAYAGAGYDQAAWKAGGLTSRAQTYDSRKWETNTEWGGIQQFRNRAYDPATGTWIQEDPIGVAGGTNLYRYNNSDPSTFSDPLGHCPFCPGALAGVVTGFVTAKVTGKLGTPMWPSIPMAWHLLSISLSPERRFQRVRMTKPSVESYSSLMPARLA